MVGLRDAQQDAGPHEEAGKIVSNRAHIVSDREVELALGWLVKHARDMGKAKERSVAAEHMLKHIKALAMKGSNESAISAQERDAYASDLYKKAVYEAAVAAGELEKMRSLREAAALKIEAWRSEQANFRAMKI
jgi:hypothetical protein